MQEDFWEIMGIVSGALMYDEEFYGWIPQPGVRFGLPA